MTEIEEEKEKAKKIQAEALKCMTQDELSAILNSARNIVEATVNEACERGLHMKITRKDGDHKYYPPKEALTEKAEFITADQRYKEDIGYRMKVAIDAVEKRAAEVRAANASGGPTDHGF